MSEELWTAIEEYVKACGGDPRQGEQLNNANWTAARRRIDALIERRDITSSILQPERVTAYLQRKGWRRIARQHDSSLPGHPLTWTTWRFGVGHPDDCADVEVPMMGDWRDYPHRLRELLIDLARIESRSIAAIVEEMSK